MPAHQWKVLDCFFFDTEMPLFQRDIIKLGLQLNIFLILCSGHLKTLITYLMYYNTVTGTCILSIFIYIYI